MNRLLAILRPRGPCGATLARDARTPVAAQALAAGAAADDSAWPEAPGACGWFDSSHALQQGLRVTEHTSADSVASELPLADWLQLHLCGWTTPESGAEALCAEPVDRRGRKGRAAH